MTASSRRPARNGLCGLRLAALLAFGLLTCGLNGTSAKAAQESAQQLQQPHSALRVITSEAEFASALADRAVRVIQVNATAGPLVFTQAFWARTTSPIVVDRPLLIEPTPDSPPLPVFDWGYVSGKAVITGCKPLPNAASLAAMGSGGPPGSSPTGAAPSVGSAPAAAAAPTIGAAPSAGSAPVPAVPLATATPAIGAAPSAAAAPTSTPTTIGALPTLSAPASTSSTTSPQRRALLAIADTTTPTAAAPTVPPTSGAAPKGDAGTAPAAQAPAAHDDARIFWDADEAVSASRGVWVTVRGFELQHVQVRVSFGFWLSPSFCELRVESCVNHLEVAMPRPFGERFWATSPRPAPYHAPWGQLFQYVDEWCYPNNKTRCYSPATLLYDLALVNPNTGVNGGYLLRYLNGMSHGDTVVDEECPRVMAYPDCVARALAKLHGASVPDLPAAPANGTAAPAHPDSHPNRLAWVLPIAIGVPLVFLALLVAVCLGLRRLAHQDTFAAPITDLEGATDPGSTGSGRRSARLRSLLTSLGTSVWGGATAGSSAGNRTALLGDTPSTQQGQGQGQGQPPSNGFVALLTGPDGIQLGGRGLLGEGSFGRVFEGLWRGRRVAVKVLTPATAAEEARVRREAALAADLSHPNIVATLTTARLAPAPSTTGPSTATTATTVTAATTTPARSTTAPSHSHSNSNSNSQTPAPSRRVTAATPSAAAASSAASSPDAACDTGALTASRGSTSASSRAGSGNGTPASGGSSTGAAKPSPIAALFGGLFRKHVASVATSSPTKTTTASAAIPVTASTLPPAAALAAGAPPRIMQIHAFATPAAANIAAGIENPTFIVSGSCMATPHRAGRIPKLFLPASSSAGSGSAGAGSVMPVIVGSRTLTQYGSCTTTDAEIREVEVEAPDVFDDFDAAIGHGPLSPAPSIPRSGASPLIMPVRPGTCHGTPRPPRSTCSNIVSGPLSSAVNAIAEAGTPRATPMRRGALSYATPAGLTPSFREPAPATLDGPASLRGGSAHALYTARSVPASQPSLPHALAPAPSVGSAVPLPPARSLPLSPSPAVTGRDSTKHATPQQQARGEVWLVMELCDGGSLAAAAARGEFRKRGGGLDTTGVLAVVRDICRGMAYLHERGIVHGDLKAENVLLCGREQPNPAPTPATGGTEAGSSAASVAAASGSQAASASDLYGTPNGGAAGLDGFRYAAKVGDFTLSRPLAQGATHHTTAAQGSVSHVAPEVLMRGELRPAADVYAFGVLLWELCSGRRAYAGMSPGEVVQAVALRGLRPADMPAPGAPSTLVASTSASASRRSGSTAPGSSSSGTSNGSSSSAATLSLPDVLAELAAECWAKGPEERPTFEELLERIDCLSMPVAAVLPLAGAFETHRQEAAAEAIAAAHAAVAQAAAQEAAEAAEAEAALSQARQIQPPQLVQAQPKPLSPAGSVTPVLRPWGSGSPPRAQGSFTRAAPPQGGFAGLLAHMSALAKAEAEEAKSPPAVSTVARTPSPVPAPAPAPVPVTAPVPAPVPTPVSVRAPSAASMIGIESLDSSRHCVAAPDSAAVSAAAYAAAAGVGPNGSGPNATLAAVAAAAAASGPCAVQWVPMLGADGFQGSEIDSVSEPSLAAAAAAAARAPPMVVTAAAHCIFSPRRADACSLQLNKRHCASGGGDGGPATFDGPALAAARARVLGAAEVQAGCAVPQLNQTEGAAALRAGANGMAPQAKAGGEEGELSLNAISRRLSFRAALPAAVLAEEEVEAEADMVCDSV